MVVLEARPGEHAEKTVLVPLLAGFLVALLRRWPLPMLGLVTAGAVMTTATGHATLPVGVLLGLALYFAALGLPRRKSIPLALAVAAALSAAVLCALFTDGIAPLAAEATQCFVPLAAAWFIADSVAARRRYQAGLVAQAQRERAAEVREERVRIAREMHDVVAHALAVITVQAGVGRCLADKRPEEATAALGSIETISRTAQDELRVVLGLLRDEQAGTAPLMPAPRLIDIKELVDTVRASGVPAELRMSGTDRPLSPSLELSIYRVTQEALTNVVKHAPGARVVIELSVSAGRVRLDVRDNGGSRDSGLRDTGLRDGQALRAGLSTGGPNTANLGMGSPGTGLGITGMRERIGAFGGCLAAGPVADGGFRVSAEIPVEDVPS
jgi:signal transduction histidine kinase